MTHFHQELHWSCESIDKRLGAIEAENKRLREGFEKILNVAIGHEPWQEIDRESYKWAWDARR